MFDYEQDSELKEIKEYAKRIKKLDDFKGIDICYVSYNDSKFNENKFKLVDFSIQKKIKLYSLIPFYGGFYNYKYGIFIYVNNLYRTGKILWYTFNKKKDFKSNFYVNQTCSLLLSTLFHESRHLQQHENKDNSFASIMCQIELNLFKNLYGKVKYRLKHDKWYMEIDANNYGISKSLEYYENNKSDTHFNMKYLKYCQNRYEKDDLLYDFDSFFSLYNFLKSKLSYLKIKHVISDIPDDMEDTTWREVLYGNKNSLRSVKDIINDPLLYELDPKFVNSVLTSRYLNNNTDYNKLDINCLKKLLLEFEIKLKKTSETFELLKDNLKKKEMTFLNGNIEFYKTSINELECILEKKNRSVKK